MNLKDQWKRRLISFGANHQLESRMQEICQSGSEERGEAYLCPYPYLWTRRRSCLRRQPPFHNSSTGCDWAKSGNDMATDVMNDVWSCSLNGVALRRVFSIGRCQKRRPKHHSISPVSGWMNTQASREPTQEDMRPACHSREGRVGLPSNNFTTPDPPPAT